MTISRVLHDIKNNKSERIKFKFVKLTGVFFLFESGMHNQIYLAQTNKRHTHKNAKISIDDDEEERQIIFI